MTVVVRLIARVRPGVDVPALGRLVPFAIARAIWSLKVAAGLALIVVAFAEKLAVPDMAVQFLIDRLLLISGAMLALLVYGSDPRLRRAVSALLPTTKELPWMSSSRAAASPA